MAEGEGGDHQSWHDLVADAEEDGGVEHVVRQADRRSHGDGVAREQRQLHAGLSLGDAVAHRRHAAGDLRRAAGLLRRLLDEVGEAAIGLVRRQHVVIGGDDAEIGRLVAGELGLVADGTGGKAVRQVGAGELAAADPRLGRLADVVEVLLAGRLAAPGDAFGDLADAGMDAHGRTPEGGRGGPWHGVSRTDLAARFESSMALPGACARSGPPGRPRGPAPPA